MDLPELNVRVVIMNISLSPHVSAVISAHLAKPKELNLSSGYVQNNL
jgi:hypothetical protein